MFACVRGWVQRSRRHELQFLPICVDGVELCHQLSERPLQVRDVVASYFQFHLFGSWLCGLFFFFVFSLLCVLHLCASKHFAMSVS